MRVAVLLFFCSLAHAAAVEIKTAECVVLKQSPHSFVMGKPPIEYSCTFEFSRKAPKVMLYMTRADGSTFAFQIDKGQQWAVVAAGQSPIANAKLGDDGKTYTVSKPAQ